MNTQMYLEMEHITKRFPGVTALSDVQFSCRLGEVHALVGENGAGKSTLMNILGGLAAPDEGTVRIDGHEVLIRDPNVSFSCGIGFVHQESNLLTNLTVCENIFLAREIYSGRRKLDQEKMRSQVQEMNDRLGYHLDPDAQVGNLKLADRQLTEIARAVMQNPKILIMDEPTAALSEQEVKRLFQIIETLKKSGVGIIYISHRLEEIIEIADRVTVLKDGKYVGGIQKGDITRDKMISMMVGRTLKDIYPDRRDVVFGEEMLKIEGLTIPGKVQGISFFVRAGEIVGLGGLEGQGQRDVVRAVFGVEPFSAGTVTAAGVQYRSGGIAKRIRGKLGYVTDDRRGNGLILGQSIRKNASIASLKAFSRACFIQGKKERQAVKEQMELLQIKASSMEQETATLSGGNQQKVMLARWLLVHPKVLIIDEPTKGVDVGARVSVYQIINDLTKVGIAVVILTSDMLELMGVSDRILMFYEGQITAEILHDDATEERLMQAASGVVQEVKEHE